MKVGSKEYEFFNRGINILFRLNPDQETSQKIGEIFENKDRQGLIRMLDGLQNEIIDIKVGLMVNKDEKI